jgi:hypothetical protein
MATVQTQEVRVGPQDVLPVRSRVSFSAIFAGAVVALACYLLLSLLGIALGLSIGGRVSDQTMFIAAAAWALITLLISLFLGGMVVSQCTAGETAGEAAVYGVIMWGVVFAMLLWLTASGLRFGFGAALGLASTPTGATITNDQLRAAGYDPNKTPEENREAFAKLSDQFKAAAEDRSTVQAAWWTFAGVLFSMLAAMAGAIAGSGPQVVIAGFPVRTRLYRRRVQTTQAAAPPRVNA